MKYFSALVVVFAVVQCGIALPAFGNDRGESAQGVDNGALPPPTTNTGAPSLDGMFPQNFQDMASRMSSSTWNPPAMPESLSRLRSGTPNGQIANGLSDAQQSILASSQQPGFHVPTPRQLLQNPQEALSDAMQNLAPQSQSQPSLSQFPAALAQIPATLFQNPAQAPQQLLQLLMQAPQHLGSLLQAPLSMMPPQLTQMLSGLPLFNQFLPSSQGAGGDPFSNLARMFSMGQQPQSEQHPSAAKSLENMFDSLLHFRLF